MASLPRSLRVDMWALSNFEHREQMRKCLEGVRASHRISNLQRAMLGMEREAHHCTQMGLRLLFQEVFFLGIGEESSGSDGSYDSDW